jgi:hypothetical protein
MGMMKNTVRLMAEFTSFSDVLTDPTGIVLLITDQRTNSVLFTLSGSSIIKEDVGIYYHDFTVPTGTGNIIYEWSGTMEGSPIVNRGLLTKEWLRL